MTTQADVDALTAAVQTLDETVNSDAGALQTELSALQAANPNLDLSGLQGAITKTGTDLQAVTALVPAITPAPTDGSTASGTDTSGSATPSTPDSGTTTGATGSTEVDPTDLNQPGTSADTSAAPTADGSTDTGTGDGSAPTG